MSQTIAPCASNASWAYPYFSLFMTILIAPCRQRTTSLLRCIRSLRNDMLNNIFVNSFDAFSSTANSINSMPVVGTLEGITGISNFADGSEIETSLKIFNKDLYALAVLGQFFSFMEMHQIPLYPDRLNIFIKACKFNSPSFGNKCPFIPSAS